jgi:serine/threonine-protein kinase
LEAFEKASRVRKGALGRDHPEVAVSLVKVGITQLLLHNFEMALVSFREALSVRKRALGALHPSTARIYNNIGCVHVEFNELREARRAFEAALDIQRNALCHEPSNGPFMFGAATTLCNLGYLYRYRGEPGKAALVLKEAVDVSERPCLHAEVHNFLLYAFLMLRSFSAARRSLGSYSSNGPIYHG